MRTTVRDNLTLADPLRWLGRGARDLLRAPWPGLSHGLTLALCGAAIVAVLHDRFWALAGAFSGFLLVAPVLATGLYAVSRALERGEPATAAHTMRTAIATWWPRGEQARRLMRFGALLCLAGTGWVLTSAAFVTGFTPQPIAAPIDFIEHVVLAEHGWRFEAWVLLGGLLAAPVFASSVVSIPLLLDRPVRVLDAADNRSCSNHRTTSSASAASSMAASRDSKSRRTSSSATSCAADEEACPRLAPLGAVQARQARAVVEGIGAADDAAPHAAGHQRVSDAGAVGEVDQATTTARVTMARCAMAR